MQTMPNPADIFELRRAQVDALNAGQPMPMMAEKKSTAPQSFRLQATKPATLSDKPPVRIIGGIVTFK